MNEIMNINGIECYEENGIAYLELEAVARGLGFTQKKNDLEYVRWETVNGYLGEIGFPNKLGKTDFIPENIFYRLAMKAKNEAAERFQAVVADEIIPSIRRHGAYLTADKIEEVLLNPDTLIRLATDLKAERERRALLELETKQKDQIIGELKPKADYADRILQSKSLVNANQIAKDYGMSAKTFNKTLHSLGVQYFEGGQWLLYSKHQKKGYTSSDTFEFVHKDGTQDVKMRTKWTQKGRLFLYELLKKNGILPLIEQAEKTA